MRGSGRDEGAASIGFDRAADFYDRTRALSPEAMSAVLNLLSAELEGRGRVLEVGAGTGRIARPLATRGVDFVGIDLSIPMLAKLVEQAPGGVPVAAADATLLPFGEGAFGAAYACHVLHLVPAWRKALDEVRRVVARGGLLLIDLGGAGDPQWRRIESRFVEAAGIRSPRPGATDIDAVDAHMASLGARVRSLPGIEEMRTVVYGDLIHDMETGIYSFTWLVDEETRVRAARATLAWAARTYGSLEDERDLRATIAWRAYDLP